MSATAATTPVTATTNAAAIATAEKRDETRDEWWNEGAVIARPPVSGAASAMSTPGSRAADVRISIVGRSISGDEAVGWGSPARRARG